MPPGDYQRNKTHCPQGHPYDEVNTRVDKRGRRSCRACARAQEALRMTTPRARELKRAYDRKRAVRHRENRLLRVYGITAEQFEEMAREQGGRCAICRRECVLRATGRGPGCQDIFVVDHCHGSGSIRGLLCHRCNKVLGLVKDDPGLLESMSAWLRLPLRTKVKTPKEGQ